MNFVVNQPGITGLDSLKFYRVALAASEVTRYKDLLSLPELLQGYRNLAGTP